MAKEKELVFNFDQILDKASEISGIAKKELGASYDAIHNGKLALYNENKKEWIDEGKGNIVFQLPDHAEVFMFVPTHVEKAESGDQLTIPDAVEVGYAPAKSMIMAANAGISLSDLNITEDDKSATA